MVRVGGVRVVVCERGVVVRVRVRLPPTGRRGRERAGVLVVDVGVRVVERLVRVAVPVTLAQRSSATPAAITAIASPSDHPGRSLVRRIAASAPRKGAVAKYAASRAAPTSRSA